MARYTKRADGRYATQIAIGKDKDGKTIQKALYGRTIKELDDRIVNLRQEIKEGLDYAANPTVKQWVECWRKTKDFKAYRTQETYDNVINLYIVPSIGEIRIKDIKPSHIEELLNKQLALGHIRTAQKIRSTVKQFLDYAIKNQLLLNNAASIVAAPVSVKSPRRSLTQMEIRDVLTAPFSVKQRAFTFLLLYTGLRRGEALALTVSDIVNGYVKVNKNLYHEGNMPVIKDSPKTLAGFRTIPIVGRLNIALSEYIQTLKNEILFPSEHNKYMSPTAFRRFWEKIDSILAIKDLSPHIFRHTYATSLYYAGVDVKTAQYLLGHASSQITLDIYTHLDTTKDDSQSKKLDLYFDTISQNISQILPEC